MIADTITALSFPDTIPLTPRAGNAEELGVSARCSKFSVPFIEHHSRGKRRDSLHLKRGYHQSSIGSLAKGELMSASTSIGAAARLLTPKEAATILDVSPRLLSRWRVEGGGPQYVRLGYRTVKYAGEALQDFITARSQQTTGAAA